MRHRMWPSFLIVLALSAIGTAPSIAASDMRVGTTVVAAPSTAASDMLEGTVINAAEGKLTMQDQDGKKIHTLDVVQEVKVTRDGREARIENLMTGDWAKITTEKRLPYQTVVVAIDARSSK